MKDPYSDDMSDPKSERMKDSSSEDISEPNPERMKDPSSEDISEPNGRPVVSTKQIAPRKSIAEFILQTEKEKPV
jgi:hypothetical protein